MFFQKKEIIYKENENQKETNRLEHKRQQKNERCCFTSPTTPTGGFCSGGPAARAPSTIMDRFPLHETTFPIFAYVGDEYELTTLPPRHPTSESASSLPLPTVLFYAPPPPRSRVRRCRGVRGNSREIRSSGGRRNRCSDGETTSREIPFIHGEIMRCTDGASNNRETRVARARSLRNTPQRRCLGKKNVGQWQPKRWLARTLQLLYMISVVVSRGGAAAGKVVGNIDRKAPVSKRAETFSECPAVIAQDL